jgi:hypothetical protein
MKNQLDGKIKMVVVGMGAILEIAEEENNHNNPKLAQKLVTDVLFSFSNNLKIDTDVLIERIGKFNPAMAGEIQCYFDNLAKEEEINSLIEEAVNKIAKANPTKDKEKWVKYHLVRALNNQEAPVSEDLINEILFYEFDL